jgi:hypothetical protein
MPELTLHFEASAGLDMEAAAAALQKELAQVAAVESARADPQRFQAVGASEILSVIQVSTHLVQNATALLTALAGLYAAWKKLKPLFPALKPPAVEVGLRKVPVNEVTQADAEELSDS